MDVLQSERLEEEHWQTVTAQVLVEYISRREAVRGVAVCYGDSYHMISSPRNFLHRTTR